MINNKQITLEFQHNLQMFKEEMQIRGFDGTKASIYGEKLAKSFNKCKESRIDIENIIKDYPNIDINNVINHWNNP